MRDPSLEEVLESNFSYMLGGVHTAIPGIIVSIRDGLTTSFVDVQPTINMISEDSDPVPRPTVLNVPLIFPVSKSGGLTFNVDVGDPVLLVYSMRGLDTWKRGTGTSVTPVDFRKLDGRDCMAIPGLQPLSVSVNNPSKRSNPHDTADTVIVAGIGTGNEVEVRLKPSGKVVINAPSDVTVNTPYAEVNAPSWRLNGNGVVNGTFTVMGLLTYGAGIAGTGGSYGNIISGNLIQTGGVLSSNGIVLDSHTHGGVQTGSGNTGGPS